MNLFTGALVVAKVVAKEAARTWWVVTQHVMPIRIMKLQLQGTVF
jgi:hypothetical protein